MSSKTKKTTRVYQSSSSSASASSRARSPSPARISRLQEKETLTNLNDRLAAYIDQARSLESENSRLSVQVSSFQNTAEREVSGVKALYEKELSDARKLIDELGKEKAKLLIEVGKYKSESDEWAIKYNRKDRECAGLFKKLGDAEARLPEAEARLAEMGREKDRYMGDCARLRGEIADLERHLSTARKQLEEETLARVDLENKIQSLKEELAFKAQLHETQMNETRSFAEYSLEDIDSRIDSEYQARLQQALVDFRADQEVQNSLYREEIELMYESKLRTLEAELSNRGEVSDETRVEISTYRSRIGDLQAQINKLSSQNSGLESKVNDLDGELMRERETSRALLAAREKELISLREEMAMQMQEYQDLLEIKCSLDMELAAYRKLLESEEERLNISAARSASMMTQSSATKSSRKRRRNEAFSSEGGVSAGQLSASGAYSCSFTSQGNMSISEVDENGKFIKIYNSAAKELSLGGWHLSHNAEGQEETQYKFHRSVKIESQGYVTVWSSSTDVDSDPNTESDKKHNFTMKGVDFFTADTMKTILYDNKNKEQASLEMKLASMTTTTTTTTYQSSYDSVDTERMVGREDMFHQQGDPVTNGDGKTCIVM